MKKQKTNNGKFLITIAGPTAVGKTDLTLQLAKKYNAHIFSADSRQLYKELTIGTAKPSESELDDVTHHFINHISIHEPYNVSRYEEDIDALFKSYFIAKDIGILTGGTGMYIKAALEGLDQFPEVDAQVTQEYQDLFDLKGIEVLQKEIKEKDPTYAAQVDMSNSRRLIRALSVIRSSGQPYSSFLGRKKEKSHPFEIIKICLMRDREELYERINNRVDQMVQNGLIEEAKSVWEHKELKSLQTVGYSELFQFFDGKLSKDEAIELIKRNSRRYAKRQMTWFRNQGEWHYIDASKTEDIIEFIARKMESVSEK